MFESISFANQNNRNTEHPIDIGSLVESMLFYQNTTVLANHNILLQLLRDFGIEATIELIEEGLLNIVFTESHTGIYSQTINGKRIHDPVIFSSPQHTSQEVLRKICTDLTGKSGKGRRIGKRLGDKIKVVHHDKLVVEGARKSFLDPNYISQAAKLVLKDLVPEVGELKDFVFETNQATKGIEVNTNLDFLYLNQIYHRRVSPKHSTITPAHILSDILNAECQLYFASTGLTELATSSLSSILIEQKVSYLLERSKTSQRAKVDFQDFIFGESKSLSEAVNQKSIPIEDVLKVLKKSQKFKKWLAGIDPDENLIKNYYSEVTRETIVDKLPGKSIRWCIFTGLGILADSITTSGLGTLAGVALGALDTFYLDKLIAGWKPNQFIEDEVKKLIR